MSTAVSTCAGALRREILGGALPPGLRLPTERELAARFGINRATVRGALAQLEAEHLVSARQGSGYTVHDYRRTGGPDLLATFATLGASQQQVGVIRDLLFVRRHLARAVLERLAERADPEDLAAVDAAIARFERVASAKRRSDADLAQADLDCLAALVAATQSTALELFVNPIASILTRLPRLMHAMYAEPMANVFAWRAVVAWARTRKRGRIDLLLGQLEARDEATLAAMAMDEVGTP